MSSLSGVHVIKKFLKTVSPFVYYSEYRRELLHLPMWITNFLCFLQYLNGRTKKFKSSFNGCTNMSDIRCSGYERKNPPLVSRMFAFIIYAWFFLITLQSYYFYTLSASIPPLFASLVSIPFLVIVALYSPTKFSGAISSARFFLVLFFSFLLVSFFSPLFLGFVPSFNIRRLFFFLVSLPPAIFFVYLLHWKRKLLVKCFVFTISLHLIFFYSQVILYYSGYGFVDFLYPITGEAQRAFGGSYAIGSMRLMRGVGLYNEPGTYAAFMMLIYVSYLTVSRRLVNKLEIKPIDLLVIFSVAMSFSTLGYVLILIFLLILFVKSRPSYFLFIAPIVLFLTYMAFEYYFSHRFVDLNSGGVGFRLEALYEYSKLVAVNPLVVMFGVGALTDTGSAIAHFSWSDLSFLVNFFVQAGMFGLLLLFLTCFLGRRLHGVFIVLVFLMLSKLHLGLLLTWILLSLVPYRADLH